MDGVVRYSLRFLDISAMTVYVYAPVSRLALGARVTAVLVVQLVFVHVIQVVSASPRCLRSTHSVTRSGLKRSCQPASLFRF